MNKTINYGVVSTAQVVPRFIEGARLDPRTNIYGISGRDINKTQVFADQYDIPHVYATTDEMVTDPSIDIIYVATYNKGHYLEAKKALQAGKHVLLEKPFALSYDEAKELFDLAHENHLFLMEAQKSLFLPMTAKIKDIIAQGQIGEVINVFSTTAYASMDHVPWFKDLDAGGGTLHFMAPYALTYLPYVLDAQITQAHAILDMPEGQADAQAQFILKFNQGTMASVYLTTKRGLAKEMRIIGTKGEILIPEFWRATKATLKIDGQDPQELEAHFQSDFEYEAKHVNDMLEAGILESPVMPAATTLQEMKLIDDFYKANN
jgi:predicted dehydrogenase